MWSDNDRDSVLNGVSRLGWLVLKRFSAAYKPSDILAAFACLPREDFELLRRLHFALSPDTAAFLDDLVPTFLRSIPSTTEQVIQERRDAPRGRIDWTRTYLRRTQSGGDPMLFVTRPVERSADSAAARTVAHMLDRIERNAAWLAKRLLPELVRDQVDASADTARRHQAHLRGRGVRQPARLVPRDLAPLRSSRRPDVIGAVRLYDLYVNLVELANENLLGTLLRGQQLAPENLDDLFEIWTLLTFVDRHLQEGWQLVDARLIGSDGAPKRPKFVLERDGRKSELFFQTVPAAIAKSSDYKVIFEDYDLDVAQRRPDITWQLETEDGVQLTLIEVKRTEDPGYIIESVYKTLGYLADFKSVIGPSMPSALLVVWKGIAATRPRSADAPVQIFTAEEFSSLTLPY